MSETSEKILDAIFADYEVNLQLPDPSLVLYYQNLANGELWLENEMSWSSIKNIIKYLRYLPTMSEKGLCPPREVTLHIMSPGGSISCMFALYNAIKQCPIPVHTINEGICHSAAFIIYLAGKRRTMNPYGSFVAHEGSGIQGGTFRESKAAMKQYEIEVEHMKDIITTETSLTKEEIDYHFTLESDWYIRYEDAKKYNIITE